MIELPRKTLFIDRNSGGRTFRALLEKAGLQVILHDQEFAQDTPDHVWMNEVGERGWVTVTCDFRMQQNVLFLEALSSSNAHVFILKALVGETGERKAQIIIDAYEQILTLCNCNSGPCLWRCDKGGKFAKIDIRNSLGLVKRRMRGA